MVKEGGIQCDDSKGFSRLIKPLIDTERKESTVIIYKIMRRWGSSVAVDECRQSVKAERVEEIWGGEDGRWDWWGIKDVL